MSLAVASSLLPGFSIFVAVIVRTPPDSEALNPVIVIPFAFDTFAEDATYANPAGSVSVILRELVVPSRTFTSRVYVSVSPIVALGELTVLVTLKLLGTVTVVSSVVA